MSRTFNRTTTKTMSLEELEAKRQEYDANARSLMARAVEADKLGQEDEAIKLAREHANAAHFARKLAKLANDRRRAMAEARPSGMAPSEPATVASA